MVARIRNRTYGLGYILHVLVLGPLGLSPKVLPDTPATKTNPQHYWDSRHHPLQVDDPEKRLMIEILNDFLHTKMHQHPRNYGTVVHMAIFAIQDLDYQQKDRTFENSSYEQGRFLDFLSATEAATHSPL